MAVLIVTDVVEDEEFQLGRDPAEIGHARASHIADGLARDVARVARVVLLRDGVLDIADHRQGRLRGERIDQRGL